MEHYNPSNDYPSRAKTDVDLSTSIVALKDRVSRDYPQPDEV
jgi:hypothetical protein